MVQLGHDEEMVPTHGMCGKLDADFETQRTIKTAELTTFFLCLLRKPIGLTMALVDKKWGWPKSKGRRFVDLDLKTCTAFTKKQYWWSSSASKRVAPIKRSNESHSSRNVSLKVMRKNTNLPETMQFWMRRDGAHEGQQK